MTDALRLATALGLHVCASAIFASVAVAQPLQPLQPPSAAPNAEPAKVRLEDLPNIVFFVAKGEANACGHGCDEWIAADGKIDPEAAGRLRRLLMKLGNRALPIFFHSPGGSVNGSLALGRLIRERRLAAGVARTLPRGCDRDNLRDKACEALKRSGSELMAEFDTDATMCNSGCVYALTGGTARLVPPWARLGIHSIGSASPVSPTPVIPRWGPPGFGSNGPPPRPATAAPATLAPSARLANSRIDDFLREMGIDATLRVEASATPFESIRFLQRDEFARFGIDTRNFGETGWRFAEKPKPVIIKSFFVRTDGEQIVHRSAMLRLSCGAGKTISVALARELAASEPPRPAPLTVKGSDSKFDLFMTTSSKAAASPIRFEVGATFQPIALVDALQSAADAAVIEIVPKLAENSSRWPRSVTLTMDGFSAAYAKLRKSCDEPVRADAGCVLAGVPPTCLKDTFSASPPPPSSSNNQMPRKPWPYP